MSQVTQRQTKRRQPVLIDEDLAVFWFTYDSIVRDLLRTVEPSGVLRALTPSTLILAPRSGQREPQNALGAQSEGKAS
jgi:hypothetical protein